MSKNWISDKLWRLAKVLYFLLSFLIIVVAFVIMVGSGLFTEDFDIFNWWKLIYWVIYTFLWYTILTILLWAIARYIRNWDFRIKINWIKSQKWIYFICPIVVIVLVVCHFVSYKISHFCSGEHEVVNEYENWKYRCDCGFGYKKRGFECVKASDEETFSWLNAGQIQRLYESTELYTWEEKLKKMEEFYKRVIWPVSFKNEYMTWWIEYQTGNVKISHPAQIAINNNIFSEVKIYPNKNIYIQKTDFDQLAGGCIENPWIFQPQTEEEKIKFRNDQNSAKMGYTRVLTEIMNGTIKEWPIDKEDVHLGRFDPYSCGQTKWPINLKRITTNGINWVIIDYNATQDDWMDCITALFKEVLLVKSMDEIYKITFDYNFWRYWEMVIEDGIKNSDFPLENKWSYYDWEVCLSEVLNDKNWSLIGWMEEYLKTWEWNANLYFKSAVNIINEIIKTIQIR